MLPEPMELLAFGLFTNEDLSERLLVPTRSGTRASYLHFTDRLVELWRKSPLHVVGEIRDINGIEI